MSPLAGKPPFATDEPDSVFENMPKPVPRQRIKEVDATAPGGARDSSYTAFDSYFTGSNPNPPASDVGDIGRGLINADYDEFSDDENPPTKKQDPSATDHPSDKHRALFEAAIAADPPPPSYERGTVDFTDEKTEAKPEPQELTHLRVVKQPQAVVHARENDWLFSQHVEPSTPPGNPPRSMANRQPMPPSTLQAGVRPFAAPAPRPPQAAFIQPRTDMSQFSPASPHFAGQTPGNPNSSTRTPQPLPPPQTPIMPVFARPRKEANAVKFEKSEILRGNSEETLLPRGAGGKGDDFWRRFSMVAKEEAKGGSKKSAWLKKTESGTTRLSTWVWIVGILFLIAIGGGIGVGWFFTHNKPASQPVAIGGSADEGFTSTSSRIATASASTKATIVTAAPVPTNTANNNNKRGESLQLTTQVPSLHAAAAPAAHRRSLTNRIPH
ncbi:hypothetical protein K439DRAFT_1665296 [Ramaria rubella]|nr:hypothetical protein K439DRAFT_1665296 [Ramaria rubella]